MTEPKECEGCAAEIPHAHYRTIREEHFMTSKESENRIRTFIAKQDLSTLESTESAMKNAMLACTDEHFPFVSACKFTIHETMTCLTILSSFRDGHMRNR